MTWQPEDKCRQDIANYIQGRPYIWKDFWTNLATSNKNTRDVGSSRNWWENACGLCCVSSYQPGIDHLRDVMNEPNDFLGSEAVADDRHYCFSLEAMMMQRRGLETTDPILAAKVDARIMQWWAQIVLCADQFEDPTKSVFIYAHQRSTGPKAGADLSEYYFRRGIGVPHMSTGLVGVGDRTPTGQDPFTPKMFADFFLSDLIKDTDRIKEAYANNSWAGISKYILRGTRGTFTTGRFKSGGYFHTLGHDFGIDEATLVVQKETASAALVQFPNSAIPRQTSLTDSCIVDIDAGTIQASMQTFGEYKGKFDPSGLILLVETSPTGAEKTYYNNLPPVVPIPTSTIGDLFAQTNKNLGVGDNLDWNYGAVTGISPLGNNHYVIRKGGGKFPWSTECIYINKDDGNAYILSETMYNVSDGEVLNMRTFWKDINTPGVLWLPKDLNNGEFYATGYAVFNNISGGTTSLPYNVDPGNNTGTVKTKSTLAMSGSINVAGFRTGFTRTDVMNENTEVYTFGIDSDGLFPYIQWDSYHNGDNVGHAAGTKKRSLGEPADAYVMFYDGTEGRMGSSTRVHSVRPTVVTEKKKSSWMSRFGCSI